MIEQSTRADTATPSTPEAGFLGSRLFMLVASVNVAAFLGYGLKGAIVDFSFWIDELYSVTASRMPVSEMLRIVATDVHPPLYYLTLKAWGLLAGTSELAVRSLSFIFVSLAICFFMRLRPTMPDRAFWIALSLYTSSYFLFFYAQEVRSYALLLLLATASYSFFLRGELARLVGASAILGLTHLFGTLLGCIFLTYVLLQRSHASYRGWAIAALGVIVLWPAGQVVSGLISNYTGGGFWIETTPLGAVEQALFTSFPVVEGVVLSAAAFGERAGAVIAGAWVLLAACALMFAVVTYRSSKLGTSGLQPLNKSLIIYGLIVGATVLVSFHTPIATKRNFIVLVPVISVILGIGFHALFLERRFLAILATVLYLLIAAGSALAIVYKMENKHQPWEEWRAPAIAAHAEAAKSGGSVFYFENEFGSAEWLGHIFRYYYPEPDQLTPLTLTEIANANSGDVLLFGHDVCTSFDPLRNRIIDRLDAASVAHRVVWFEQFLECLNGYVIYE